MTNEIQITNDKCQSKGRFVICHLKFVIILSFVLWNLSFASYAETVGKIVAIVNDEVITQQELEDVLREFQDTDVKDEERWQKALDRLIEDKLILHRAKEIGISVAPEELEEVLRRVKSRFPSQEAFEKTLLDSDLSFKAFEIRHKHQLLIRKTVLREVRAKCSVSPHEVEEYYKTHPEAFQGPEAWRLSHILVRKQTAGREDPEAKRRALQIFKRLRKGENFEALAKNFSEGPQKEEGGDLGYVERGTMAKEIEKTLAPVPLGGISEVIETSAGYHLFRVVDRKSTMIQEFKKVRTEIYERLLREKIKRRYEEWMAGLKKDAYIHQ